MGSEINYGGAGRKSLIKIEYVSDYLGSRVVGVQTNPNW